MSADAQQMNPDAAWLFGPRGNGLIEKYLDLLPRAPGNSRPFRDTNRKIVIACTSRTGSTLLCHALSRYGVAADEYLLLPRVKAERDRSGAKDYGELFAALVKTYAASGVFCVKGPFASMLPIYLSGEFPQHLPDWSFVYLWRRNFVRQAISLVIAQKTESWKSVNKRKRDLTENDYDRAAIAAAIDNILTGNAWWEKFFSVYGLEPLRIEYEEFLSGEEGTLDTVAKYCGLTAVAGHVALRKPVPQTTMFNRLWEERFRAEASTIAY